MGGQSPSVATGSPASSRPSTRNSLQPLKALENQPTRWPRARALSQVTPGWSSGSGDPYVPGQRTRTSRAPAWAPRSPVLRSLPTSNQGGLARRAPPAASVFGGRKCLARHEEAGPESSSRDGSPAPSQPFSPCGPGSADLHPSRCSVRLTPVGGDDPLLQILFPPRSLIFIPFSGNSYSEKFSSPFNDHWQSKKPSPPTEPLLPMLQFSYL